MSQPFLIGFTEPHERGELIKPMGAEAVIVAEITRDKFLEGMDFLKSATAAGMPGKAGMVHMDTKQYHPTTEVPEEMKYFYVCLPPDDPHLAMIRKQWAIEAEIEAEMDRFRSELLSKITRQSETEG